MNTPHITSISKSLLACAVVATAMIATGSASAAESTDQPTSVAAPTEALTQNPVSIALLAGHGFKDAFKTGFGGRIGYTLENKFYVGASGVYHTGISDPLVSAHVWYAGGEVGYDLAAGPFVIRPYAGAGIASIFASVTIPSIGDMRGGKVSANESRFAVWPGASFLFPFENGSAFVGVDAKFVVVETANAFNTYGTFGMAL